MDYKKFFIENNKSGFKTREKYLKNNFNELYISILGFITEDWFNNLTFKEKIWYFINNVVDKRVCLNCGKDLKFKNSLLNGYGEYCSIPCANKCETHKNKVVKTNLIKYGVSNPMLSETIKKDIKLKMVEKYGVDNIFKDTEYIKNKTIEKYGVEHIAKLPSTQIKREKTNLEKYGFHTPLLNKDVRNKGFDEKNKKFLKKYEDFKIVNVYNNDIIIICDVCGSEYLINRSVLYHRHNNGFNPCTKCNPIKDGVSISEKEISNFIKSLGINIIVNDRNLIQPLELDIVIPEKNIVIEYNGIYWHSEKYINKNYHLNKTELCNNIGYRLVHIFEDEWLYKKEIVKSRLKNMLGLTENKIFARKCEIKEVSSKEKTIFLDENHIQGKVGSKINLGLYYNDELVSLMTFSNKREVLGGENENNHYELIRFCNKLNTNVIGGASKLLKHFISNYNPKEIISYADRRWSDGNLYETLGFTYLNVSPPNYFYVKNGRRENRIKYQKHKLVEQGFDKDKSEREIMEERGFDRIYDCGTISYSLKL